MLKHKKYKLKIKKINLKWKTTSGIKDGIA